MRTPVTDTQLSDRRRTAKRHIITTSLAGSQRAHWRTVRCNGVGQSSTLADLAATGARSSTHFKGDRWSVGLSSSAAGGRDAITAGSLTSSLMSDCRMRSAWGPRRLRAVGFRAYMTRHEPRLLGTRGPFNRDHFFPCFFLLVGTCGALLKPSSPVHHRFISYVSAKAWRSRENV